MKKYLLATAFLFSFFNSYVFASDARTYVLMPNGTDLTEFRVAYSEVISPGKIDTHTYNQTETIKHTHYFNIGDNLAAVYLTLPYTHSKQESNLTLNQSGIADSTLLFAWGVYNTPALGLEDFKKYNKNGFSAACSVAFTLPTGKYSNTQTFNIGTNRYSAKPECQGAWTQDKFMFELIVGLTTYQDNNSYFGNNKLKQDNLYHVETHTSYNFTPRLFASFDTFYVNGGNAYLNNQNLNKSQSSFSVGSIVGYTIDNHQLIKFIYQNTVSQTATSVKLQGVALSYNYLW